MSPQRTNARVTRKFGSHKRRRTEAIELAIANGLTNSEVMALFDISYIQLQRIKAPMLKSDRELPERQSRNAASLEDIDRIIDTWIDGATG